MELSWNKRKFSQKLKIEKITRSNTTNSGKHLRTDRNLFYLLKPKSGGGNVTIKKWRPKHRNLAKKRGIRYNCKTMNYSPHIISLKVTKFHAILLLEDFYWCLFTFWISSIANYQLWLVCSTSFMYIYYFFSSCQVCVIECYIVSLNVIFFIWVSGTLILMQFFACRSTSPLHFLL